MFEARHGSTPDKRSFFGIPKPDKDKAAQVEGGGYGGMRGCYRELRGREGGGMKRRGKEKASEKRPTA
ncbi:unnamed protein product [Ectocarpus sp. CCAP 1310/34]|nr:unnamed protein product [Ectocarpus sp. CCAP 1310/34]